MNKSVSESLDWHPYKMNGYLHDLQQNQLFNLAR